MAIRAFISTWSLVGDRIENPIVDYIDTLDLLVRYPIVSEQLEYSFPFDLYAASDVIVQHAYYILDEYMRPGKLIVDTLIEGVDYSVSPAPWTNGGSITLNAAFDDGALQIDSGKRIGTGMYYPDKDLDGIPDKDRVLILVRTKSYPTYDFNSIKNLTGVKMLPAYRFDKPISEIPQNIKNAIKTVIVNEGIPLAALSDVVIYGDFIKKAAKYLNVKHEGLFSRFEAALASEFK